MLNTVSERIRKILKSQDQIPQGQIYKQRQISVDSNRSGTNSKSNIASVPPKSPNKLNPHSQSTKTEKQKSTENPQSYSKYHTKNNKNQQKESNFNEKNSKSHHSEKEQEESRLIGGSPSRKVYENYQDKNKEIQVWDEDEIVGKIKDKVMECLYPILAQFQKKIQASIGVWKGVQSLITELEAQKNQSSNNSVIFSNLEQLSQRITKIQQKIVYSIEAEMSKLSHQYITISQKLSNSATQPSSPTSRAQKNYQSSSSFFGPKGYENQFIQFQLENQKVQKCKCQKLVEEILKSQDHLMMELKYVKHFIGTANNNGRK